jgi:chromosome partitioning protein
VNLSACLGLLGKSVLLIDADPQGNATSGLGIHKKEIAVSSYDVIIGNCKPSEAVIPSASENVRVIPSHINLAGGEVELAGMKNREYGLRTAVAEIREAYDFILIDCPPSLGLLTINALRQRQRPHSDPVRILRAGGAFPAYEYRPPGEEDL